MGTISQRSWINNLWAITDGNSRDQEKSTLQSRLHPQSCLGVEGLCRLNADEKDSADWELQLLEDVDELFVPLVEERFDRQASVIVEALAGLVAEFAGFEFLPDDLWRR